MERSNPPRVRRITRSSREALWSAAPLPRFSLNRRINASTVQRFNAFTLVELLIVLGIVGLLLVLMAPAFTYIKGGNDVTSAAYTIKGVLETARTYAKANNTYTWVGFYEEDATAVTPTNNNPPYPGKGRVLIAAVASKDGTKIFEDADPAAALPPDRITQVGKLVKVEGIHLT